MAEYKVLPNNLESEQAVLGCVLIDQDAQVDLLTTLDADDFYSEAHRKIFKAMQSIFAKNIPVDFVTLTSELEVEKELEKVGGIDYITYLTNVVPSAANFKHYCDIVVSNSVRRSLIKGGQAIIEDAFQNAVNSGSLSKVHFIDNLYKPDQIQLNEAFYHPEQLGVRQGQQLCEWCTGGSQKGRKHEHSPGSIWQPHQCQGPGPADPASDPHQ